ncbi:hypothetical protein F5148DRAFT_677389 [Russula earlei]|uniref:Uncharacterized protein n=1 Tax=Russula earlei TaxID=71964 RepID=A0ACC0UFR7_9AGAM|nr:hypothetical protein F5148DRAFT_677389 [Russula earlei]
MPHRFPGLETLGVMHPHWHSASPEIQRRLISLYLLSLTSASFKDTASLTATMAFESELHYVRSPQDVAAVLRWGLRHLRLDGDSFGNESGDWTWYHTFAEAERAASYPPEAFSKLLIPQLPAAHTELLLATLDIISSLSTRGDANGSSGSKLSKLFGLWLLISERSVQGDDWTAFYDRWARAGRILEHLFLARIRNDAPNLPRRLTDLIEHYPYDHVSDFPKDDLLPRPRFSTRQYDALFVRLDTEYAAALKPKSHPLRLIADALRAECTNESVTAEDDSLWDAIKKASLIFDASEGPSDAAPAEPIPIFSNVFSDETIRLLSLIPVDVSDKEKSAPTFVLQSPISLGLQRSFSLPETPLSPVSADHGPPPSVRQAHVAPILIANNSTAPTTASPDTPADWLQFSSQGFGAIPDSRDFIAKLWDDDIEVTVPPAPLSRKSSRRAHSRRSSVDTARMSVPPLPAPPPPPISKTTLIAKIKLDEAFIDFWADSLLDPISKRWPPFVLCQLKPLPSSATFSPPTPTWLVIEQRLVSLVPVSPVKEEAETTVPPARPRASSPRPSLRTESSRLSAAFSIASKRFTFFTGGSNDPKSPQDRTARLPQVGEFGEVANVIGDDALAKESREEAGAKVDVGVGAALVVDAAALTVAGAAAAAVAATHEEIAQTPKENVFSAPVLEIARSELAGVSVPKADLVKDEPRHAATTQNGPAQDIHQDEEHRELDLETAATQGPGGADAAMVSSVDSKPVETYSQLPVTEAEITQLEQETVPVVPQMAGRAKAAPPEPETIPLESAPVLEPPAPEPSTAPVVDYATPDEEKDAIFVVSEPVILDGPPMEEPKFSGGPPAETMQALRRARQFRYLFQCPLLLLLRNP